ncbi:UbiH/UbiF/VisC/COQ6 family ubiquinone biosynthesis hydroxylase [Terricaulis silvestris]|uniref:2-octaprenyl-6-methoxyphenol hydroxylase n=1 Tax=Terricaulis silvestris TaxID=2686094 RepID=A0A6I6MZI5_9CAUL|nr:UbiH/UbiF/VisC/COQ6 family ubiquinone biosynthesis hydroxylase [Terricaulis silvestris]QGZ97062.1 2-octaprenyl-6-methoxyphenol hydroxylase [Terricaulis silvestris]
MSNGRGFDADVILGGGGLVGQTLALALDQAGVSVAVIDASKPADTLAPTFDGRAFAIAFASFRMWRALGIGDQIDAQPIEQIMVTDGRLGDGVRKGGPSLLHLHFDRAEMRDHDEPLGLMCEARHVRLALDSAVKAKSSIRMIQPMSVTSIERDPAGVRVALANGETLRAPLLVGTDGRRSFVRQAVGIRTIGWDYPATAIVATIAHEEPHNAVAYEHFLPNGPFAILPLTGNRSNIVWAEPRKAADALLKMGEDDFLAELRLRFGDFLGELSLEGPRFGYPLSLQLAERMIDARVALAGDSAHGIHPLAGQGLNLGLKDCAALAECIADGVALGLDPGDVSILERYQRWRRFDNVSMALGMEFFDKLFSNDIRPLAVARRLGLGAVNAVGPARRFFMKYAGGGAGDLPKLLRGESLAA